MLLGGGRNLLYYLKKAAQGIIISIIIVAIILIKNRSEFITDFFLYETLPYYSRETDLGSLFKLDGETTAEVKPVEIIEIVEVTNPEPYIAGEVEQSMPKLEDNTVSTDPANEDLYTQDMAVVVEEAPVFKVSEVEVTYVEPTGGLIGLSDVIYQPEAESTNVEGHFFDIPMPELDKLKDSNYLANNFYIVDNRTGIKDGLINAEEFLSADMSIKKNVDGPQVLVFHTHSQEKYRDSNGTMEGVVGVGKKLCEILESKYGIKTMHDMNTYDLVDEKSHILGAYERMEVNIEKILRENPTIEIVIDLHRDGVSENIRLLDIINGKPTAQIMFFNGLSTLNENGTLKDIVSLPNYNLKSNLAFSFQMQLAAKELYDGFTRKVYLHAYRYSLHMLPKSLLIEVGAQTNTKEEAFNAMEPLADILAKVVLNNK